MVVNHIVVDSGGFINNAPIREISKNVYTLSDVVAEIKDKSTKQRLQVLPYELHLLEPTPEDISFVTAFSKKTGDYPSLSPTDLKLLALTVHLHSRYGKTPLKTDTNCVPWKVEAKSSKEHEEIIGFYKPSGKKEDLQEECEENKEQDESEVSKETVISASSTAEVSNNNDDNDGDDHEDDSDDESTWIGPDNLSTAQEKMGSLSLNEPDSEVGCITTDFAMQNMLIQLGLPVISTKGMLIREAKTFVLRCHACFHVTSVMTKKYCPRCGNQTLKRVSVSIGEDGQRKLHINFRRPINIRGKNQSLPMPKGGKHGNDPIVSEDQPVAHNRPKKSSLSAVNPLDPDYEARSSPFALHDVHSRAAQFRTHVKRKSRK